MRMFDAWTARFTEYIAANGKVEPAQWRAFGYTAPAHRRADVKLKWRGLRMGLGVAPSGSSSAEQERLGLNDDATLSITRSEGGKLRQ